MAELNPNVVFIKVDVDDASEIAAKCGISAMPTFHYYKGGEKVAEVVGADVDKIKALVATATFNFTYVLLNLLTSPSKKN